MNRRDFIVGLVGAVVAGELVERLAAEAPIRVTAAEWGSAPCSIEEMQRILREVYADTYAQLSAMEYESPFLAKLGRAPRSLFNPPARPITWSVKVG